MGLAFQRIGIFAKPTGADITPALQHTCNFLQQRGHNIILETNTAHRIPESGFTVVESQEVGEACDLVIVIGGDGSLLKAARAIVDFKIPILGVNRGNLGFLADLTTHDLETGLGAILEGEYVEEQRTMLNATLLQNGKSSNGHLALNDIVLHHGDVARLIEFQIFVDQHFLVEQRADGVITSTPTGSTAYALSGGGPIIYPTLDVITLMPMFPHALNTRPIVIDKNSHIRLVLSSSNRIDAKFSADGQMHLSLARGDEVHIHANKNNLRLLHPKSYDYFAVLREKLGWNIRIR